MRCIDPPQAGAVLMINHREKEKGNKRVNSIKKIIDEVCLLISAFQLFVPLLCS